MKIGFIGLGIMGAPMVGRLLDGGHQVFANDLKPIRPEILEKGATEVSSAKEATEMGDVIIVMVPDTPDGAPQHRLCTGTLQQCRRPGKSRFGPLCHGPCP